MKTIIITGGSGFIGSHFIELILEKNFKIVNIDLRKNSLFENEIKNKKSYRKKYFFIKGNICNKKFMKKILLKHKPSYIVNFAAQTHVDKSIDNPNIFYNTNVLGVLNILNIIKNFLKNTKFLQISTDEVYGSLNKKEKPFNESSRYKPNSPYSASKAAADHLALSFYKTYGLNILITNCSNNFGERQHPEKLIPLTIIRYLYKEKIPIYGKGNNVRDWIYVKDHCRGVLKVLLKGKPGQTFLIGARKELSNLNIVKLIIRKISIISSRNMRHKKLISFVKDRPGHDYRYAINSNKIRDILSYKPIYNFEKVLIKTITHYIRYKKYYKNLLNNDKWFKKRNY